MTSPKTIYLFQKIRIESASFREKFRLDGINKTYQDEKIRMDTSTHFIADAKHLRFPGPRFIRIYSNPLSIF